MVSITQAISVAVALLSTASATSLNVNTGCIIANNVGICAGNPPLYINGNVDVYACIDRNTAESTCFFSGFVPTNWDQAYWGADNCLYSAGSSPILVGCADSTSPQPVPNPY